MVQVIILALVFSFLGTFFVIAAPNKEAQDKKLKTLVAKKKSKKQDVTISANAEVASLEKSENAESKNLTVVEYQNSLGSAIESKQEVIENLLSEIIEELAFFETVLFDRNQLSFSEKILFDRIIQFVQNGLQQCNDLTNSEDQKELLMAEGYAAYAYQLLISLKESFMRLECLTIGKYEMDSVTDGLIAIPLSETEVKQIVLKVALTLIEDFERDVFSLKKYYETVVVEEINEFFDFPFYSLLSNSIELKEHLVDATIMNLPEYLQVTWANTLLIGGSEKKCLQQAIKINISCEVYKAYAHFLYEIGNAKKTGKYESAAKALAAAQNLVIKNKALCVDRNSIGFKVLKVWDFKLSKMAVQLEMSKKAKEFCTTPEQQEVLIKHNVVCNDILLRGLIKSDHEFADYFRQYARLVELYLFSGGISSGVMVEIYQLVKQMDRMLEVNAQMEGDDIKWSGIPVDHLAGLSWIKSLIWKGATLNSDYIRKKICEWFYPPNLKKIYLTDMITILSGIARAVNKQSIIDGAPVVSSNAASDIFQGGWAQNDYGSMLKNFLGNAVQGQAKSTIMQMIKYASPVAVIGILKYLMPSLSGTIKQSVSELLALMSNDSQATPKADSFSQPVKEKVTKFLESNPGLLDSVKPEQLKDLVAQTGVENPK